MSNTPDIITKFNQQVGLAPQEEDAEVQTPTIDVSEIPVSASVEKKESTRIVETETGLKIPGRITQKWLQARSVDELRQVLTIDLTPPRKKAIQEELDRRGEG